MVSFFLKSGRIVVGAHVDDVPLPPPPLLDLIIQVAK